MTFKISRQAYAEMVGPTTGDRIRLADTELLIEIEKDFTTYGEEVKFGGGKVIRDGMGQSQRSHADVMDTVITNAVIVDHWGIVKADIGLKDGKIAAVGPKLTADKGTKVIDGKGGHVWPGMINSATELGLQEISSVRETVDTGEIGAFNP